ncbi:hypothetical protein THAOC_05602, partial [Thalassiosira oceanica]
MGRPDEARERAGGAGEVQGRKPRPRLEGGGDVVPLGRVRPPRCGHGRVPGRGQGRVRRLERGPVHARHRLRRGRQVPHAPGV